MILAPQGAGKVDQRQHLDYDGKHYSGI